MIIFNRIIYSLLLPIFLSLYPNLNKNINHPIIFKIFGNFYKKIPLNIRILIFLFCIFINFYTFFFSLRFFNYLNKDKKIFYLMRLYKSNNYYYWGGIELLKSHAILLISGANEYKN
jgi:hypothetical protein